MMDEMSPPIWAGDNIFADLGIPNPEEVRLKAQSGHTLSLLITENGLTKQEAARQIGTTQAKVIRIRGGKVSPFTSDRLLHYLRALEWDIVIKVRPRPASQPHGSCKGICEVWPLAVHALCRPIPRRLPPLPSPPPNERADRETTRADRRYSGLKGDAQGTQSGTKAPCSALSPL